MIDWAWIGDHVGAIAGRAVQHVELAAIALAFGFAIAFGLSIVAVRYRRSYVLIAGLAGIFYTIPSLAIFPVFVRITGLGTLTAEIPLVMYTQVIFIRNIVAGLDSVPDDVADAADGMGFTRRQRFTRIELPLAVPLIVAGLRLASVSTIGLVTITAILGQSQGGFGFFILERPFFATEVLVGAIGSIVLAIAADIAFAWLQGRLTPWVRVRMASTPDRPARMETAS